VNHKTTRSAESATPLKGKTMPAKKAVENKNGARRAGRYEERVSRRQRRRTLILIASIIGAAIVVLGFVFFHNSTHNTGNGSSLAGQYAFQVGSPGPGAQAPQITLPATNGTTFDLAAQRGKTVLLYFQEGLTCQPCWDQLKDIQSQIGQFHAQGITTIVSITTDPLVQLKQKVADEKLSIPVLSDPNLTVSQAYSANSYGMMGSSRDGHTFVLVGPDGRIKWRADYGGAPNYTMYVPVSNLVADIKAGLQQKS
jgi:peroxiredoxin